MGIPLGLATVHLLSGAACLAAAAALAVWRAVRVRARTAAHPGRPAQGASGDSLLEALSERAATAFPVLAVAATAWPALVRPLLNGDSIGYHLPNAAAWAHDGHIWLTTTRYWWYPPGSEIFASGLFAVGGPFVVGLAGTAASLLFGLRLSAWGRRLGVPAWAAGALAAATAATFTFGEQAGNLENDVWLAALFLETLWCAREEPQALVRTAAACALVKPDGGLYALLAMAVRRVPVRSVALALLPLGLWAVHDAVLWQGAVIPPASTAFPDTWGTTLAGNGVRVLPLIAQAIVGDGLWLAGLTAVGLAAIVLAREGWLRIAAAGALVAFMLTPFAFATAMPQLASGQSLRYAAPFFGLAALAVAALGARFPVPVGLLAIAAATSGILRVAGVYRNDATTHSLAWVVPLLGAALLCVPKRAAAAVGALAAVLAVYAAHEAASHPVSYYDAQLGGPKPAALFAWLATHEPSAVVGWQLRIGAVNVVAPATRALDALDAAPCAEAVREHAFLVLGDDPPLSPAAFRGRRDAALDCGVPVYRDGASVVVAPR